MERHHPGKHSGGRTGLARALSKLGYCSRTQAAELIRNGRVKVGGTRRLNPEHPVDLKEAVIEVDGRAVIQQAAVYIMMNKPAGLVTTRSDEKGRPTVYERFSGDLPHLSPVGRLDRASEGMLLFTNDTGWADAITSPQGGVEKTYHVQIDRLASADLLKQITDGVLGDGQMLSARRARILRTGQRNSWLELILDEGKNRHIRRLLEALDVEVLRLVRVSIGPLQLGTLAKGAWRHLKADEVNALTARHGLVGQAR